MALATLRGETALRSALCAGLLLSIATPAFAQSTSSSGQATPEEPGGNTDTNPIIVTGSRIARPNLQSDVSITTVTGKELLDTPRVSIGDQLNELPSLRSTFSQANSTLSLGTAGLNLLDLRGLGTQRTLVLQNGRRHVAADILVNGASVDVNTIPVDLIERVDITTGGGSAIYGSDAIAGVVNFVLKRDYQGLQIRSQAGISSHGDAGDYFVSATGGQNFADGRGNIALSVEYAKQNQYFGDKRNHYRQSAGFVTVDSDPAGTANGSDGNPDRVFYRGLTSSTLSSAGYLVFPGAGGYVQPYYFEPDGSLTRITGKRIGVPPYGSYLGANRSDGLREGGQLQLLPQNQRISANLLAHFTVSDAFEPFIEAKYVRIKTRGTGFSGPAFTQAGSSLGSPRERFYTDNAYLNPATRAFIRNSYGDYYGAYDPDNNPLPDGVNDADQFGFTIWKNLLDFGVRDERATRETYRIVGGVRGTFNEDWNYEISANYGRFKERTRVGGNVNAQRYLLAIDAVDQGQFLTGTPNGKIMCRSQLDPSARIAYENAGDPAYAARQLANDVAQCVPVNLFGRGNVTDAARNYVTQDTTSVGRITQFVVSGSLAGDTSQWFELPGGPIGFAVGGEYRRETNYFVADPLIEAGMTFYNALPTFRPPSFAVKEVFGELRAPILKERPFFHELSLNGALRFADYKGSTGSVLAWNVGGAWAPVPDIRFRANYSKAVRAPNLTELYASLGQNFALINDPCSARNIGGGTSTREANCRAAGVPAGYDYVYIQSLQFLSGGNPNLKAENSKSLNLGVVVQPRFLPGLSLSVDYYDIKVDDVITAPSAQSLIDACYDAASLNNQFCALIQRNQGPGNGPRGEIPGRILEGTLPVTPLNYAALKVRGIDVELVYRRNIEKIGDLSTRLFYTHVIQNDQYLDPVDPKRADQNLYEMGNPRDEFMWNVDLKTGPFTFGYQLRYIGKQLSVSTAEYEYYFSKQGRPPQDADFADPIWAPTRLYHSLRMDVQIESRFNFYLGVKNLTDKMPPFYNTGIGDGSAIWDNVGRSFYAGVTAKF